MWPNQPPFYHHQPTIPQVHPIMTLEGLNQWSQQQSNIYSNMNTDQQSQFDWAALANQWMSSFAQITPQSHLQPPPPPLMSDQIPFTTPAPEIFDQNYQIQLTFPSNNLHETAFTSTSADQCRLSAYEPLIQSNNVIANTTGVPTLPFDSDAEKNKPKLFYRRQDLIKESFSRTHDISIQPVTEFNVKDSKTPVSSVVLPSNNHRVFRDSKNSFKEKIKQNSLFSVQNTPTEPDDQLDANKRKQLPAWIREGLERMERDKQKQLEKEQQELQRAKEEELRRLIDNEKDDEEEQEVEFNKIGFVDKLNQEKKDESLQEKVCLFRGQVGNSKTFADRFIVRSEFVDQEKEKQSVQLVRGTLTEILLEVTNSIIRQIAIQSLNKARLEKATTVSKQLALRPPIVKNSALGGIVSMYGSSSEESGDESNFNSTSSIKSNLNISSESTVNSGKSNSNLTSKDKKRSLSFTSEISNVKSRSDFKKSRYDSRRRSKSRSRSYEGRRSKSRSRSYEGRRSSRQSSSRNSNQNSSKRNDVRSKNEKNKETSTKRSYNLKDQESKRLDNQKSKTKSDLEKRYFNIKDDRNKQYYEKKKR